MTTTASPSLRAQLDDLHADYVESINTAIAIGNDDQVTQLAAEYDRAATTLVATYENKLHLLPLDAAGEPKISPFRRWLSRVSG